MGTGSKLSRGKKPRLSCMTVPSDQMEKEKGKKKTKNYLVTHKKEKKN